MHAYEPHLDARYPQPDSGSIPAMRPPHEAAAGRTGRSATPIFDALYAEYRRLFRALPGDRSGEEQLRFGGFDGLGSRYGTDFTPVPQERRRGGAHRAPALPALPPGS
ncbi:hypothetical protein [Streptomyces sp. JJ38]|uniref:hypothetical protein n=1 Tax=Streptomyces sp. JJ38 TaxID=2738128 RepID=UPI001C58B5A0|nr:hypothetical protein [Streptomyces sp. JJ38]MBW1599245.1 hypothetical protein [Streptomyces sp. JJ38]